MMADKRTTRKSGKVRAKSTIINTVIAEPTVAENISAEKAEDIEERALKTFKLKRSDVYSIADRGNSIRILTKNGKKFIYPKSGG